MDRAVYTLSLCLCFCGGMTALTPWVQGATDFRTASNKPSNPDRRTEAPSDKFEDTFAKAMNALKTRSFEEARILFNAAAENVDIKTSPLSWLTAEMNACHAIALQGLKPEAEALAKQIATRCESALGEEDPITNEALSHLAFVLKHSGHLEKAEPVYRRNLQLLETKYGQDHYVVATAMCKHASLLQSLGRLAEAEAQQRKAFAVVQKISVDERPNVCYFLTNLACCLQATGKTEEANGLMDKAFAIVSQTSDSDLTSAGSILRKQAEFYRDAHQLDRAEALGHRALLRLAKRPDINRARFYYYDLVADVYRSILSAQGLSASDVEDRCQKIEAQAAAAKATASSRSEK